jgi:two-component system, cell cycle sensor histidine kinase and response regulator CckA
MSAGDDPVDSSSVAPPDDTWIHGVLEDANIALWTYDGETGAVQFQRDRCGSLGYVGDALPRDRESWLALIHPGDRERSAPQLEPIFAGATELFDVDCRVRSAKGEWLWIRVCGRVMRRRADGTIDQLAGLILDISARLQAEAALQDSERRYRTLVENQGEGIGIVDEDERFTFANPAADEIFGVDPGALVGRSLYELLPSEEFDRIRDQTGRRQEGERSSYEVAFTRQSDGARRTLLVTATPHFLGDRDGFAGAFGVFRDITARREAEEKKGQLEDQLRQAAKMESLGQLAGGVAHDLNNLLSPIMGYTEMLLQDMDRTDPMREDLLEIEEAANRARDLTQQLTAFSRKQVLQVRVLNLNDLVGRTLEMLRRLIREDIAIELSLAPDLGNTRADEGQIQQILLNLTINARDAIGGAGTIRIETRNMAAGAEGTPGLDSDPPVDYVRLTIRDTGQGMDEEIKTRIFEPFFSTKHKSKGTGLGLATVHGIVRQHDGRITVDSTPGAGSTFHVYLPRTEEAAKPRRKRHETADLGNHCETVLVVEDDDAVRRHVCRLLARQGFRVLEARGGTEALECAKGHPGPIHVLVTDVVMPRMNGREVYLALCEVLDDLKVVFMSGYTDDVLAKRSILGDDIIFLQKPFTRQRLISKIEEALAS